MKIKITALLLLCSIGMLSAQLRKWTLEECVTYAVENNLTIEQFRLDLDDARIDKLDAIGNFAAELKRI